MEQSHRERRVQANRERLLSTADGIAEVLDLHLHSQEELIDAHIENIIEDFNLREE
jgi:hypothetical protein